MRLTLSSNLFLLNTHIVACLQWMQLNSLLIQHQLKLPAFINKTLIFYIYEQCVSCQYESTSILKLINHLLQTSFYDNYSYIKIKQLTRNVISLNWLNMQNNMFRREPISFMWSTMYQIEAK